MSLCANLTMNELWYYTMYMHNNYVQSMNQILLRTNNIYMLTLSATVPLSFSIFSRSAWTREDLPAPI